MKTTLKAWNAKIWAQCAFASVMGLAGCAQVAPPPTKSASHQVESPKIGIYLAQETPQEGLEQLATPDGALYLHPNPALTEVDVFKAFPIVDSRSLHYLGMSFTKPGAAKLAAFGKENQGKLLALVVDHELLASLTMRQQLDHGLLIFAVDSEKKAIDLAAKLNGEKSLEKVQEALTTP